MKKNKTQWFWFIGGFALGFSLIAIGHASVPKKATQATSPTRTASNLSELKAQKLASPSMDQDYAKLTSLESRYAESADQQKKLKTATLRNARRARN